MSWWPRKTFEQVVSLEAPIVGLRIADDSETETTDYRIATTTPPLSITFVNKSFPKDGDGLQFQVNGSDHQSEITITQSMIYAGDLGDVWINPLEEGSQPFTVIHTRGASNSPPSVEIPFIVDFTAPVISDAEGEETGSNTFDLRITTDEGNGRIYVVVTENPSAPTDTQIIAGQNESSDAPIYSANQLVTVSGEQTIEAEDIPGSTGLYAHFVHVDEAGNISNVDTSASFATSYIGPGDIVSMGHFYGVRAYSAATATALAPCIDVVDSATGLTTTTINLTAGGFLDVAAVQALGYAVRVSKIYDQVGTAHLVQGTNSARPVLDVTGGPGSRPKITFTRSSSQQLTLAFGVAQPVSLYAIARRSGSNTSYNAVLGSGGNGPILGFDNGTNRGLLYASGAEVSVGGVTDGNYHFLGGYLNGGSSTLYTNGTTTAGSLGSQAFGGLTIGNSNNSFLDGDFLEGGYLFGSDLSSSLDALRTNAQIYWPGL